MVQFSYPEDCSFCKSRVGSAHCLLPFQFVKQYVFPIDEVSKIIDITEIHMHYGINTLRMNYEMLEWVKTRPTQEQVAEYSASVRHKVSEWHDRASTGTDAIIDKVIEYSHNCSQTESSLDDISLQSQLPESFAKIVIGSNAPMDSQVSKPTITPLEEKSEKEPLLQTIDSHSETIPATDKPASIYVDERIRSPIPTREDEHIVDDLVVAAKAIYNFHQLHRNNINTDRLIDSISFESGIRNMSRERYNPSFMTDLDNTKTLSREIIARHSSECVKQWETGINNMFGKYCILNFEAFSLDNDQVKEQKLRDNLIMYIMKYQKQKNNIEDQAFATSELLNKRLIEEGRPKVMKWIINQSKLLSLRGLTTNDRPESSHMASRPSSYKGKETFKDVSDPRVVGHINSTLEVIINKVILKNEENASKASIQGKDLHDLLFLYSAEFLTYNKGWLNDNSFTSIAHIAKLEESTRKRLEPSDRSSLYTTSHNIH